MVTELDSNNTDRAASVIWDFLNYNDNVDRVDVLIVLGSVDLFVPQYASVFAERYKPKTIICSGGIAHENDLLHTGWNKPEAFVFKDVMSAMGSDVDRIICEDASRNTQENIRYSLNLLSSRNIGSKDVVFIHKPYMTLRTKLTITKITMDSALKVHSPPVSYRTYYQYFSQRERLIHIIVGDFQRIIKYQEKGYIAKIAIPNQCTEAFNYLIHAGFTAHLLK